MQAGHALGLLSFARRNPDTTRHGSLLFDSMSAVTHRLTTANIRTIAAILTTVRDGSPASSAKNQPRPANRQKDTAAMPITGDQRALNRARRKAEEAEQQARRMREAEKRWKEEGMYLTRAEFEAGQPCRGCGEPLLDGLGSFPPLLQLTPGQQADYDREQARWQERHGDCNAMRWTIEGSRTTRCMLCCPPTPLSYEQIEGLSAIFAKILRQDPASLMVWELALTCGHTVRKTQHKDYQDFPSTPVECAACDGEIMGVIVGTRIGPADEADAAEKAQGNKETQSKPRSPARPKPSSKIALRRRLRKAEAQAEALHIQLAQLDEPQE